MRVNLIGAYGEFVAGMLGEGPGKLSYRNPRFGDVDSWRAEARAKVLKLLGQPQVEAPEVEVIARTIVDGVEVERLRWRLPYGPPTDAVFLKPQGAKGPLPGIVALHDHGGLKYFGWRKIASDGGPLHPLLQEHQASDYGGRPWANAIAKRGYAVICHDTFPFGSRRVRIAEVPEAIRRGDVRDVSEAEETSEVQAYNQWAAEHEHVMSKSLFAAGTTWPGLYTTDDQVATGVLAAREEVDAARIGCCGLSGGGLRTVMLGGLDDRIQCAVCVGMMTTWRDVVLDKNWTHTWMMWVPGLPRYLDYPEILGLRVPKPTMVLNNNEDPLFSLPEMQRADRMLREVFEKAGASDRYACRFYPGPHKFDLQMQADAFAWLDQWLKR